MRGVRHRWNRNIHDHSVVLDARSTTASDPKETLEEIQSAVGRVFPGAEFKRLLLWQKP
jgi:hypothetical protein